MKYPGFHRIFLTKFSQEGGYHIRGPRHQNGTEKDPNFELANIIPLDGREYRRVITINDEFPGPVIRVTEGSVVKVRVQTKIYRAEIYGPPGHLLIPYWSKDRSRPIDPDGFS